jgi:hypothetical protein
MTHTGLRHIHLGQDGGPRGHGKKASSKKRKKCEPQSYSMLAVHEKATREYLARLSTHTVDGEALTAEGGSVICTFALQKAEWARNMVIQTPQFPELPLPHGDPRHGFCPAH